MGLLADQRDQNDEGAQDASAQVTLNEQQEEAADHVYGSLFVSACPGSGKTRVIVERAARLVEKGIKPQNLLCITFTNKASGEMRERLEKRLGEVTKNIYISTFHGLCANILRKYGPNIGYTNGISIIDSDDQESIMAACARQLDFEMKAAEIRKICWDVNSVRETLYQSDSEFIDGFDSDHEAQIAKEYLSRLKKANQVDFSGLLSETIRLLEEDKETLDRLQQRFKLIQVDEAQDTNLAQFRIVEMIGIHKDVVVVGDIDQSIYGWRGARYDNINDFIKNNKAKVVELPLNYRSTPEILRVAEKLIRCNDGRQSVEFETTNESGDPVEHWVIDSPDEEGHWISQKVSDLTREEGWKPEDFAVLYRANAQSRAIETGFVHRGIPYQVIGSRGFYDRGEVRDALAMLRFLMNPADGAALARFINKPARGIGDITLGKIENMAMSDGITVLEALTKLDSFKIPRKDSVIKECKSIHDAFSRDFSNSDLGETLDFLLKELDYDSYLYDKHAEKYMDKRQNLQELITSATLYSKKNGNDIQNYLNGIALMTNSDKKTQEGSVTLMTMHAAKGLEFPVVFIPSLEDGILPHARSMEGRDAEEERRLCYVAMTRAEKKLITSRCKVRPVRRGKFLKNVDSKPSRFLFESGILRSDDE